MTDARVYRCDDTSCYWNHGQTCTSAQIELDADHKCKVYINSVLAEEAMAQSFRMTVK